MGSEMCIRDSHSPAARGATRAGPLAARAATAHPPTFAADEPSTSGFFLVPWADDAANEATIKEETKATLRCYPFAEQHRAEGKACFFSGRPATHMALFARAY